MHENIKAADGCGASLTRAGINAERAEAHGVYRVECVGADGKVKWVEEFDNLVTTVGKNFALDTFLAGAAYTVNGPFLGLINSGASAAALGNTMASHAGWLEVGGANLPTYSGTRKTPSWSAAASGSKAAAAASFAITDTGTVGGCFLVLGTGASASIDDVGGVLYSAGAFAEGNRSVLNGDTLNVTYAASL